MIGIGLYWMLGIAAVTVLLGMVAKWIIEMWLTEREASIASFSLALGSIPGSLLLDLSFDYVAVTEKIGSATGLAILWWLLFRRQRQGA
jgi:hypothetical protein